MPLFTHVTHRMCHVCIYFMQIVSPGLTSSVKSMSVLILYIEYRLYTKDNLILRSRIPEGLSLGDTEMKSQ